MIHLVINHIKSRKGGVLSYGSQEITLGYHFESSHRSGFGSAGYCRR